MQSSNPAPQAQYTCTDLYDVMKGSMRWKPGPLVEVSRAPPLQWRERQAGSNSQTWGDAWWGQVQQLV